jgi:hypothetical protein
MKCIRTLLRLCFAMFASLTIAPNIHAEERQATQNSCGCVTSGRTVDASLIWVQVVPNVSSYDRLEISVRDDGNDSGDNDGNYWYWGPRDPRNITIYRSGPDGVPVDPENARCVNCKYSSDATVGAAIGKIGTEGRVFRIGRKQGLTSYANGPLFVMMNDVKGATHDNTGDLYVEVKICPDEH